ncbi:GNAT family N-acetyltransferase [uncultured Leifsonia sp.]|jgi:putative acetyltransferase|uniref:GNAT family N-acetyltransferase n=1 Tax=uncultured Leifsonia sp. TaxID=340359 RepID=UPI0025DC637C|nr:GNAT family N-acetyltransferase [uncultured Leifsonia sp.]
MITSVSVESARADGVAELLQLSNEFTLALYPAESCYLLDASELDRAEVTVFVGRDEVGAALGMAALVDKADGTAELKRMFVRPEARGRGLAAGLLRAVEAQAAVAGIPLLRLETGPLQHAAIALYESRGYERIPNFGEYVGDPHSVCYAKTLRAA